MYPLLNLKYVTTRVDLQAKWNNIVRQKLDNCYSQTQPNPFKWIQQILKPNYIYICTDQSQKLTQMVSSCDQMTASHLIKNLTIPYNNQLGDLSPFGPKKKKYPFFYQKVKNASKVKIFNFFPFPLEVDWYPIC